MRHPLVNPNRLDELLLSKSRLGILALLLGGDEIEYSAIRDALGLSDGNLSVQIYKLEETGYIKIKKTFVGRRPKTYCRIAAAGKTALARHVKQLGELLSPNR